MNRVCSWIFLLLLCVGCQDTAETAYLISGRVNNPDADGNIIYLSHSNGDELVNLDSAIVDGGAFSFRGVQEAPIMAYLRFNRSLDSLAVPLLFILENGTIVATMDTLFSTVTGTEQNDTFETYRAEAYTLDSLRRRLHEHYLDQVHAGRMDTAVERSMFDEYTRLREREKQQAYRFIRRNSYSPAALWLLESMQSQFHEEELQSLLSGFGGRNRNVPVLMNIAQRLRNAHKIEPGNPYIDISLIEQSGREFNLSDYVGYARYTVVGFWRSDSAPSCRAMVKWSDLCRKFAYRGAAFVSVSLDTDETKWREKAQELRLMGHQCLAADPADVENRYALASIPRFVLITPDGSIESRDMAIDELESRLQELLPYRVVKRDTAVLSIPDSTVLVKRPSI